jgi:hypothetical protein
MSMYIMLAMIMNGTWGASDMWYCNVARYCKVGENRGAVIRHDENLEDPRVSSDSWLVGVSDSALRRSLGSP